VAALNALCSLEVMQEENEPALAHAEEARTLAHRAQDTLGLASALVTEGHVARAYGTYEQAATLFEEGLGLFRTIGDAWGTVQSLTNLGEVHGRLGNYERATELLEEGRLLANANGYTWGVGMACRHLGRIAFRQGDLDRATALLEEALVHLRGVGATRGPHWALYELGNVLLSRGEYPRAAASYGESLALCRNAGDRLGTIRGLEGLAAVDVAVDDADATIRSTRAVRLLGAATAQREALGTVFRPADRPMVGPAEAAARSRLGDDAFAAAWAEGRAMSLEQAVAYALDGLR
jgi:tetratricopeptide (TPR) repeat protein